MTELREWKAGMVENRQKTGIKPLMGDRKKDARDRR